MKAKGVQFLGAHPSKMTKPRIEDDDDGGVMEYDSESDSEETNKSNIGSNTIETARNTKSPSKKLPNRVSSPKMVVSAAVSIAAYCIYL